MQTKDFTYSFKTAKTPTEVFDILTDIKQWWYGLYNETIKGSSRRAGDVFTFDAGDGAHYSKQQVVELVPDRRIVWQVTESKLSFLQQPAEWNQSRIGFELTPEGTQTLVVFTHQGLQPQLECYGACSSAWTGYLDKLKQKLN